MKTLLGRTCAALLLTLVAMVLYRLIGFHVDRADAHVLRTSLDEAIPFWSWSVYLYSWVYTSMVYPLFVIRCPHLFKRVAAAYGLVLGVTMLMFALFPVTAVGFRPDVSALDLSVFHEWGVRLTYYVDPPYNLFPSMHLSIAAIAALSAFKARRAYGLLALPVVLAIAVSICTMKQHYILDGVAALALAACTYLLVLHPYRPPSSDPAARAYSWRGPAAYFVFHALVYLGLYVAFRLGFAPWS